MERLQQIADQLEETGTLNADTVAQLRQVVDVLTSTPAGPGARTAAMLGHAAEVFTTRATEMQRPSGRPPICCLPTTGFSKTKVAQLQQAADVITATGGRPRR